MHYHCWIKWCPIFIGAKYDRNNNKLVAPVPAGKAFIYLKSYPSLAARRRRYGPRGKRLLYPSVALLALIAGLLQILSNLANDYGRRCQRSDKPDRIITAAGMQRRHHPTGDEAGVNRYRRRPVISGPGRYGGRVPYVNRFCRVS